MSYFAVERFNEYKEIKQDMIRFDRFQTSN